METRAAREHAMLTPAHFFAQLACFVFVPWQIIGVGLHFKWYALYLLEVLGQAIGLLQLLCLPRTTLWRAGFKPVILRPVQYEQTLPL
jgi:hypothetical protein